LNFLILNIAFPSSYLYQNKNKKIMEYYCTLITWHYQLLRLYYFSSIHAQWQACNQFNLIQDCTYFSVKPDENIQIPYEILPLNKYIKNMWKEKFHAATLRQMCWVLRNNHLFLA
jgi:hypothetical protein